MKIVVLDGYTENPGDLSWRELEELGELTVYDRTDVNSPEEIISRIGDADFPPYHGRLSQYLLYHTVGNGL